MKISAVLIICLLLFSSFPAGLFRAGAAQTYGDDFEDGTLNFWTQGAYGDPYYWGRLAEITNYSYNGNYAANLTCIIYGGFSFDGCTLTHEIDPVKTFRIEFMFNVYADSGNSEYYLLKVITNPIDAFQLSYAGGEWGGRFYLRAGSVWDGTDADYGELNVWHNITVESSVLMGNQNINVWIDGVLELHTSDSGDWSTAYYNGFTLHATPEQNYGGSIIFVFDDVFYGAPDNAIPVGMPPYVYTTNDGDTQYLWFSTGTEETYLIDENSDYAVHDLCTAPHRSLGIDQNGYYHVVWDEYEDYCYYANSTDGGQTWSTPLLIQLVPDWNFQPLDMAVDSNGYIHLIGLETDNEYLCYIRLDNVTKVVDYSINDEFFDFSADLCVDTSGNIHIAGGVDGLVFYINYTQGVGFGEVVEITSDYVDSDWICIEPLENGSYVIQYQDDNSYDYHSWFGDWSGFGSETTFGAGIETEIFDPGDTDGSNQVRDVYWRSQTFTVGSNPIIIQGVSLWMYKGSGTPQTVTVGIRETSGGKPIGSDLAYGTRDPTGFLTSPGRMEDFTLVTPVRLEANTMYAIVCRSPTSDSSNWSGIRFNVDGFSSGTIVDSSDNGINWTINTGADYNFNFNYNVVYNFNCFSMITEGNTILISYLAEVTTVSGTDECFYYVNCTEAGGYGVSELIVNGTALSEDGDFGNNRFDLVYNYTASKPELVFILDPDNGDYMHWKAQRDSWGYATSMNTSYVNWLSALWNPYGFIPHEPEIPPEINDYGIANMEGCGNWVFEGNTKYLFYTTATAANTTNLQLGLGFYDGASRWFSMLYNTNTTAFTKNTPESAVSVSLKAVSLSATEAYVSWEVMFHNQIADSLNVTLYTFIGSASDLVIWNATAPNYFNIYNIGGFASYQSSGDAGRLEGGDVFELYTYDTQSWSYAESIYKYLQHVHFLASWDLGNLTGFIGETPYLLCPSSYDPYTGTLEYGIYVCHGDIWVQELSVRLDIADGFVAIGDDNWVLIRVRWYHLGELIKTDYIYNYDFAWNTEGALWGSDTSVKIWVDLWFNKVNASTTMGGRVGSYMVGVRKEGWWLWEDYHPLYSESTFNMCFTTIHDESENVLSAKEVKMMKTYCNLTQTTEDWDWEVKDYTIFTNTFAYATMEGIDTPSSEFQPAQDPTLPVGGLLGGLSATFQTLAKSIAYSLTFGALAFAGMFAESIDFLAGLFGVTNFTDMLLGSISGMMAYVALASTWLTTLYSYVFGFLGNFFYWLWTALDATLGRWQQMWALLGGLLSGTYTGTVGLWDYFQLGSFLILFIVFIPFIYFEGLVKSRSPLRTLWSDFNSVVGFFSTVLDFLGKMVSAVIDAIHAAIEAIPVVE